MKIGFKTSQAHLDWRLARKVAEPLRERFS